MDKEKRQAYAKKYYLENRQETIERAKRYRRKIKKRILEYKKAHPCKCGENHPAALDLHHVEEKDFNISDAIRNGYAWYRIEAELKKCQVVCRNCHAKLHWSEAFEFLEETEIPKRIDRRKIKGRVSYWKGKVLSEETKKKMSEAKRGRAFSVAHKEALSKAMRGKPKPWLRKNLKFGKKQEPN